MKPFYLLLLILFAGIANAQQAFQGSIVYNLHDPKEPGGAELAVFYGPNKIKIKYKDKDDYDKTFLLVDIDSGKLFIVNTESKTFQAKKLAETISEGNIKEKTIAGHNTIPISVSGSGFGKLFGYAGNLVLFAAPDLYFPIPKKYEGIPELVMIQNNHIVLGAEVKLAYPDVDEEQIADSLSKQSLITAEAKQISPQNFSTAEFVIPADFIKQERFDRTVIDSAYYDSTDMLGVDTSAMIADTAFKADLKPYTKPKPKPSSPKKTTPTKTDAIKPKKSQNKT